VRDAEAEEDEQVEVEQAKRPSWVHERREKEHAERQPDVWGVELAAERPLVAARHRPCDLVAGPLLEQGPAAVVHLHLRKLAAVAEEAHLPEARALDVGGRLQAADPPLLADDLLAPLSEADHLLRAPVEEARRLRL
jgi:hypothetical protein